MRVHSLDQTRESTAGRLHSDVARGIERHLDPGRDHEGQREPVRDDDLMGTRAGQDAIAAW